jgi:hypothetical protein
MTTRQAFERGTDTFNGHDINGFADVLADDVFFVAPGGMRGEGKAACDRLLMLEQLGLIPCTRCVIGSGAAPTGAKERAGPP